MPNDDKPELTVFCNEKFAELCASTGQSVVKAFRSDAFKIAATRIAMSAGRPSIQSLVLRTALTTINRINVASGVVSAVDSVRDSHNAYKKGMSLERATIQGTLGVGAAVCGIATNFTTNKIYGFLWTQKACALTIMKHSLDAQDKWGSAATRDICNNSLVLGLSSLASRAIISAPASLLNTFGTLYDSNSAGDISKILSQCSKTQLISLEEIEASKIVGRINKQQDEILRMHHDAICNVNIWPREFDRQVSKSSAPGIRTL